MNKVCIISINSPQELTGGGHYFRCLIKGYEKLFDSVQIIGKDIDQENFSFTKSTNESLLKKTAISDIFSRLFFSPSFLLYYWLKIRKILKNHDVIAFHSSRLGMLVFFTSLFFKNKKIITHFDNVECLLLKDRLKGQRLSIRYLVGVVDYLLISFSEKLCLKYSNECTFITREDANYFGHVHNIIPICYDKVDFDNISNENKGYYLFTGSFDFEPNIDALEDFKLIAIQNPQLKFLAAGRNLSNLDNKIENLMLIDSPSVQDMDDIFNNAKAYISCVKTGSGMKTKVAEAMRYGLYIFATDNSLVGYDDICNSDYVYNYKSLDELNMTLKTDLPKNKKEIVRDFNLNYSIERVICELSKVIG